jgi:hypothetical protein
MATRLSEATGVRGGGRPSPTAGRVRDRRALAAALSDASRTAAGGLLTDAFDPSASRDSSRPSSPVMTATSPRDGPRGSIGALPPAAAAAAAEVKRMQSRHADDLSEAQRAREEMRGQLEVRQFALQHATDARDAAIQRAEHSERELAMLTARHADEIAAADAEAQRQAAALADAQSATRAALEQSLANAERAMQQEARANAAERTCATLRLAVESLDVAKQQVEQARDEALAGAALERSRAIIERALLREYASECEQGRAAMAAAADAQARETERVEAALTDTITAGEAAAEAERVQSERTMAQLRGHIEELEEVVAAQQAAHERERAELSERFEAALAESTARAEGAEAKSTLLAQQLNALAEAAQTLKAERTRALIDLSATAARLEAAEEARAEAEEARAAAAASEAAHLAALDEVREEVAGASDRLAWLESCTRDAAEASRPLLSASDDYVPVIDAEASFGDERERWSACTSGLHTTILELSEALAWLTNELQTQLSESDAAGSAASPARELHEDLAEQIRLAAAALPSAFAPPAAFERGRTTLVEAVRAQAQLAVQSVAHLISCAADAEAVATLQAKQVRSQHSAVVQALHSEMGVALSVLGGELGTAEDVATASAALAWQLEGGLRVYSGELAACELQLDEEALGRQAANAAAAELSARLDAAMEGAEALRDELRGALAQLSGSREREAALEQAVRLSGLEGQMAEDELLMAVRQAEESGAEHARQAQAARLDAQEVRDETTLERVLLRTEVDTLERSLAEVNELLLEAQDNCAAIEAARAAAHGAYEREMARCAELDAALGETRGALSETQEEAANAAASARRHAAETVEWAAKAQASEAVGAAEAAIAATRQATLVGGLGELDEAVRRLGFQLTASRAEAGILLEELQEEEGGRAQAEGELLEARMELARVREAEEQAARERANARAAQQALQQASLHRELRVLQRQLVYPALTLGGSVAAPDLPGYAALGALGALGDSSEDLWAGLLSEPNASTAPLATVQGGASGRAAAYELISDDGSERVFPASDSGGVAPAVQPGWSPPPTARAAHVERPPRAMAPTAAAAASAAAAAAAGRRLAASAHTPASARLATAHPESR